MQILVPVSIGELYDKLSILEIKSKRIEDKEKLQHIQKEFNQLTEITKQYPISREDYKPLYQINNAIWGIEDNIREKERRKEYDEIFIKLAQAVYIQNDKRSSIKKEINAKYGSDLMEVKSYKEY